MAPVRFGSIAALEENSSEMYLESTEVLIRIARNVLKEPLNPKYRSVSLKSNVVTTKLLPASGAMECLFDMGFQEGDGSLVLSQQTSLDSIKYIHDELLRRREQKTLKKKADTIVAKTKKLKNENKVPLIANELNKLERETTNSFLKKIIFWCFRVLAYENYELQRKALTMIPLTELNLNVMRHIRNIQLEYKKKNINEEAIDFQELLLVELCNWFNNDFFTWVDTPQCTKCGFIETVNEGISQEIIPGSDRVEKYRCQKCNSVVLFPRFNDPHKLLETRKGRCGEWANCFCSMCRALGWDSRLVFDETDHVWVEVYSLVQSRWIHCDPCEKAVDTPLMYECGWKKNLSYIIAYSLDDIQDVTWRYSTDHIKILQNRNKCNEQELIDFIVKLRNLLLNHTTPARKQFVLKRTALELIDLLKQKSVSEAEERGRTSGSMAWRLMRGETSLDDINYKPHIWRVDEKDIEKRKFELSYVTAKDTYYKDSKAVMKSWMNGVYKINSVFRNVEKDWKMCYLARREGTNSGLVSWRFETGDKFSIGSINLKLVSQIFETGVVTSKLCSGSSCVQIPQGQEVFTTDAFKGSSSLELIVELLGSNFWQHSQLLRQPIASEETTFEITINLLES
ncbi:hypothetical protein RUM43_004986 [Polyplax serrata]|uniref:Peptide-N(4)-(N-acetyl-beta-glucosaminyl)asparagine amidase n=1 Tax=Polyplax serrata TaxID=468196 RepID=A0AAN8XP43_POLSC